MKTKILTTAILSIIFISSPLYSQSRSEESYEEEYITPKGMYMRGIVPGWGQYYAGHSKKAMIYGGSFAVSGGFFAWSIINKNIKLNDYNSLPFATSTDVFNEHWDRYVTASWISVGLGSLAGIVYIMNWIDLIIFGDEYLSDSSMDGASISLDRNIYFCFDFREEINYKWGSVMDFRLSLKF